MRLNGAGYTYESGARIMPTVLLAKNARYCASASSTTSWYADENSEIRMFRRIRQVITPQLQCDVRYGRSETKARDDAQIVQRQTRGALAEPAVVWGLQQCLY